jgi:hypothetical protein
LKVHYFVLFVLVVLIAFNTMSGFGDLKRATDSVSAGVFEFGKRVSFFVSPKVDSAIGTGRWFGLQSKAANDPAASVMNHQGAKSNLEEGMGVLKAWNDVLVHVKSRLRGAFTQLRERAPFDPLLKSQRWLQRTAPTQSEEEWWAKAANIKMALQVPGFEQSALEAPASESMKLLSPTTIMSFRAADIPQDAGQTIWENTSNALSAVVYEPG